MHKASSEYYIISRFLSEICLHKRNIRNIHHAVLIDVHGIGELFTIRRESAEYSYKVVYINNSVSAFILVRRLHIACRKLYIGKLGTAVRNLKCCFVGEIAVLYNLRIVCSDFQSSACFYFCGIVVLVLKNNSTYKCFLCAVCVNTELCEIAVFRCVVRLAAVFS